ncbi:hypothetical protein MAR_010685 [Mya arenaria]|uniref:Uncharacterized protein n=1 Tax=Mya arenaria TaxID=6604 RepID=A0ABY7FW74_MYAAR|nr:hypothetical protein MAR_010685 [Mya arenaria]
MIYGKRDVLCDKNKPPCAYNSLEQYGDDPCLSLHNGSQDLLHLGLLRRPIGPMVHWKVLPQNYQLEQIEKESQIHDKNLSH